MKDRILIVQEGDHEPPRSNLKRRKRRPSAASACAGLKLLPTTRSLLNVILPILHPHSSTCTYKCRWALFLVIAFIRTKTSTSAAFCTSGTSSRKKAKLQLPLVMDQYRYRSPFSIARKDHVGHDGYETFGGGLYVPSVSYQTLLKAAASRRSASENEDDKDMQDNDDANTDANTHNNSPKQQAISALSQPNAKNFALSALSRKRGNVNTANSTSTESILPLPIEPPLGGSFSQDTTGQQNSRKPTTRTTMHPSKKYLHVPSRSGNANSNDNGHGQTTALNKGEDKDPKDLAKTTTSSTGRRRPLRPRQPRRQIQTAANVNTHASRNDFNPNKQISGNRYASMLPPPIINQKDNDSDNEEEEHDTNAGSDNYQNSLSSWEQFLGAKPRPENYSGGVDKQPEQRNPFNQSKQQQQQQQLELAPDDIPATSQLRQKNMDEDELFQKPPPSMAKLPSIQDLFPPDLSLATKTTSRSTTRYSSSPKANLYDNQASAMTPEKQQDIANLFPSPRQSGSHQRQRRTASSRGVRKPSSKTSFSDALPSQSSSSSYSSPSAPFTTSQPDPQSFLPDRFMVDDAKMASQKGQKPTTSKSPSEKQLSSLEGVLPVSDLFYRSSQSIDSGSSFGDDEELPFSAEQSDQLAVDHNKVKIRRNQATAFASAPSVSASSTQASANAQTKATTTTGNSGNNKIPRRKMVRRGMEMLVGGVPINADPPQRSIELSCDATATEPWYNAISLNTKDFGSFFHSGSQEQLTRTELGLFCEFFVHYTMKWDVCPKELTEITYDFIREQIRSANQEGEEEESNESSSGTKDATSADAMSFTDITSNASNSQQISPGKAMIEKFVNALIEEDPELLRQLLSMKEKLRKADMSFMDITSNASNIQQIFPGKAMMERLVDALSKEDPELLGQLASMKEKLRKANMSFTDITSNAINIQQISPGKAMMERLVDELSNDDPELLEQLASMKEKLRKADKANKQDSQSSSRGFGKPDTASKKKKRPKKSRKDKKYKGTSLHKEEGWLQAEGELAFSLGISEDELCEYDDDKGNKSGWILADVLRLGISSSLERELKQIALKSEGESFRLELQKIVLTKMDVLETDDGMTSIDLNFKVICKPGKYSDSQIVKGTSRIEQAMERAIDDGELQLSLARTAREETRWPVDLRERMYEEFLFEEDDEDKLLWEDRDEEDAEIAKLGAKRKGSEKDTPKANRSAGRSFGRNDDVIWDYSEENCHNAPFKGMLGPRLLDAMEQYSKEQRPKVIAVGDVHGCIDELQDLLRQCDYRPGDLIVFLGDLVSKGPDSISVVQMAREIGAIGVRGNHDFEVIRWHQAIKSGVDPPVVGSEHFHVASCLSKADVKWLYSLPWYITSKDMSALFVHAGFVSGIRLAKQNPRLMMNMRSILPDGTVTSKFFNNWPWARLWDGPQTVFFGHDADRGLQQYEHAIGLDTGCVYGGRLTACILPEKRLVSVSAKKEYFKYRRKHYD